jgi:hypothetical protein
VEPTLPGERADTIPRRPAAGAGPRVRPAVPAAYTRAPSSAATDADAKVLKMAHPARDSRWWGCIPALRDDSRTFPGSSAARRMETSSRTTRENGPVIRVRRVPKSLPMLRRYELEISSGRETTRDRRVLRRGRAHKRLTALVGTGDAWAFLAAADRACNQGRGGWAVDYEPPGKPSS